MSWLETDRMEQKIRFIKEMLEVSAGEFAGLCRRYNISRKTGYKWRRRYREGGNLSGLEERSRRPHRSPRRIARELEERIMALRQPYGWGAYKIAYMLWKEGQKVSIATVHRTLLRQKAVHRIDQHSPAPKRFEREEPNDLFQTDFKGPMGREGARDEPLSVLDDHSRYVVGLYALRDHGAQAVQECFGRVFERYGRPRQMLMDHGTPWWNNRNGWGLTSVSVFLIEQDIDLIYGKVAHPQTQAKWRDFIERSAGA